MRWRLESAPHDDGTWFVAVRTSEIRVLAPPGTLLSRDERAAEVEQGVAGWRLARWYKSGEGAWPLIDSRRPDDAYQLSTRQALYLLPASSRDEVWLMLVGQLESVRRFARSAPGQPVIEELAQTAVRTATWLETELEDAFPSWAWQVRQDPSEIGDQPEHVVPIEELTQLANGARGAEGSRVLATGRLTFAWIVPWTILLLKDLAIALRDERSHVMFPAEADVDTRELIALSRPTR